MHIIKIAARFLCETKLLVTGSCKPVYFFSFNEASGKKSPTYSTLTFQGIYIYPKRLFINCISINY